MISIECGHCFPGYRVKPALAGRRVKYKECGHAIRVPKPRKFDAAGAESALPPRSTARRTGSKRRKKSSAGKQKRASTSSVSISTGLVLAIAAGAALLVIVLGLVFPGVGHSWTLR